MSRSKSWASPTPARPPVAATWLVAVARGCAVLLVCGLLLAAQELRVLRPGEPLTLEVPPGVVARAALRERARGTLHVWVGGEHAKTELRIRAPGGGPTLEDDGSGGQVRPFLVLDYVGDTPLELEVVVRGTDQPVKAVLHASLAVETTATEAAARSALEVAEKARAAARSGEHEAARARLRLVSKELLAVPGAAESFAVSEAAWRVGNLGYEFRDVEICESAWTLTLAFREARMPDDHPHVQNTRVNLGLVRSMKGDASGARALFERALAVFERILPADSESIASTRFNLSLALRSLGELARARILQEQVLAARAARLPDEHPQVQSARASLSITLAAQGELTRARVLDEQVLEAYSRTLPEGDPRIELARGNLAGTLFRLGDLEGARLSFERQVEALARVLPEDHTDLQRARSNLAGALDRLGQHDAAAALQESVLEVWLRELEPDHPDVLQAQIGLGEALRAKGDLARARDVLESTLDTIDRTTSAITLRPMVLLNLSAVLHQQGAHAEGLKLLEDHASGAATGALSDHPDALEVRSALVVSYERAGRLEDARAAALELARLWRAKLAREALLVSPREAEALASSSQHALSVLLSLPRTEPPSALATGLDLEALAWIEQARGAGLLAGALSGVDSTTTTAASRSRAQRASEELARISRAGADRDLLEAARREADAAAREFLAVLREQPGAEAFSAPVSAANLAAAITADRALVSYWRYVRFGWDATRSRETTEDSMVAFVLRSDGHLRRVELGALEAIETAVERWRVAVLGDTGAVESSRGEAVASRAAARPAVANASRALRALVLDPLMTALTGVKRLVVAPDVALHAVPFDVLCLDDALVAERWSVETRSALRELAWPARPMREGTAVCVGGASFGAVGASGMRGLASFARGGPFELGFPDLASTASEARGMAVLFRTVFEREPVVLEGERASRANLEALVAKAQYLHVATHGWVTPEAALSSAVPRSAAERFTGLAPMALCGLALAGANQPADPVGNRPGLVTAEEFATWDLSDCELAVLSACDTHVGVRRAGQGVASLQKALQIAGARSVITSLWKVPDEATKELMLDFYRRMWMEKKPKWLALKEAKRCMRDAKDEQGNPKYALRDWAAWVLTGEPE